MVVTILGVEYYTGRLPSPEWEELTKRPIKEVVETTPEVIIPTPEVIIPTPEAVTSFEKPTISKGIIILGLGILFILTRRKKQ